MNKAPVNDKIREQKMREIAEVAYDIFCEKGFEATKFSDIAVRLEIARSTIYLYFKNKLELIRAAMKVQCSKTFKVNMDKILKEKSFIKRLKMLSDDVDKLVNSPNIGKFASTWLSLASVDPEIARIGREEVIDRIKQDWYEIYKDIPLTEEQKLYYYTMHYCIYTNRMFLNMTYKDEQPFLTFKQMYDTMVEHIERDLKEQEQKNG